MTTAFQSNAFQNNAFQIDAVVSAAARSAGVGKGKKPPVLRYSEVSNREDIGNFLKAQLKLRHPDSAFTPESITKIVDRNAEEKERKRLAKQARREKEMRLRAETEAAKFAKSAEQLAAEQKKSVQIQNDNMKLLMMIASVQ